MIKYNKMNIKQIITINYTSNLTTCNYCDPGIRFDHIPQYYNIKNKEFVFCCDLLIMMSDSNKADRLDSYKEFKKLMKPKYWTMDNCIMIIDVANTNNVELFKYILQYIKFKNDYQINAICFYCCQRGLFDIVEYVRDNLIDELDLFYCAVYSMLSNSMEFYNKYKNIIIKNKYQFVYENYHNPVEWSDMHLILYACLNGNLSNVKLLAQDGFMIHRNSMEYAATSGNLELMKWLLENGCKIYYTEFLQTLKLKKNRFRNLKWLCENSYQINDEVREYIVEVGTIEIFKYFLKKFPDKFKPTEYEYDCFANWYARAASTGNIGMLRYLWGKKYRFEKTSDKTVLESALNSNDTKTIKWVLTNYPCKYEKISTGNICKYITIKNNI